MTDKILVQFSMYGDGSWDSHGNTIYTLSNIFSLNIEGNWGEQVPKMTIKTVKNLYIREGNEIRFYANSTTTPNTTTDIKFRGFVDTVTVIGVEAVIECSNMLVVLKNRVSQNTFAGSLDIVTIINSLVTGAGLTVDSSDLINLPRPVILTDYDCSNYKVFEKLLDICSMIDAWFYYDYSTNKVVVKRRVGSSSVTLELTSYPNIAASPDVKITSLSISNLIKIVTPKTFTITINGTGLGGTCLLYYNEILVDGLTPVSISSSKMVYNARLNDGSYVIVVKNGANYSNMGLLIVGNVVRIINVPKWSGDASSVITNAKTIGGKYTDTQVSTGTKVLSSSSHLWEFQFNKDVSKYKATEVIAYVGTTPTLLSSKQYSVQSKLGVGNLNIEAITPSTCPYTGCNALIITGSGFDGNCMPYVVDSYGRVLGNAIIPTRDLVGNKLLAYYYLGAGDYTLQMKNSDKSMSKPVQFHVNDVPQTALTLKQIVPITNHVANGVQEFDVAILALANGINFNTKAAIANSSGTVIGNSSSVCWGGFALYIVARLKAGTYNLILYNGNIATPQQQFTVYVQITALNILSISPATVIAGRFNLTIYGSGFDPKSIVKIVNANGVVVDSGTILYIAKNQKIIVSTVNLDAGIYNVTVTNSSNVVSNKVTLTVTSKENVVPSNKMYVNVSTLPLSVSNTFTSMKLSVSQDVTNAIANSSSELTDFQLYGVREAVVHQQNLNDLTDVQTYTDNIANYWSNNVISAEMTIADCPSILGSGVNIVDNVNKIALIYNEDWNGIVKKEVYKYPSFGTDITVADHVLKSESVTALLNKLTVDKSNLIRSLDPVNLVKVDGSATMTGDLDMNNQQLTNMVVENVQNLE
jgi:hypothetical protein